LLISVQQEPVSLHTIFFTYCNKTKQNKKS